MYAIPSDTPITAKDPYSNQAAIFIAGADNESGQPVAYGYLLNVTTDGSLNYTATPSSSGLYLSTGDSGLNASVTFFAATERGYSVSQVSNVTVDAMQAVNFTALYTMSVVPCYSLDYQGCDLPVSVRMMNAGDFAETFNVTVYANDTATGNSTIIAVCANVTVEAYNPTILALAMNTTDLPPGNYVLSAYATLVPSETGAVYDAFATSTVEIVQATNGGGGGRMPYAD